MLLPIDEENEKSRSPHGERGLKLYIVGCVAGGCTVALLTESVDWNITRWNNSQLVLSLSSRSAWIEINIQQEY